DDRRDRSRAAAPRRRQLRRLRAVRRADRRAAVVCDPVGPALHRRPAPDRLTDVRVGSSTDGLTPLSVAERSLAAWPWQWGGLCAVLIAAVVADQVTKHIVTSTLSLDESVHVVGPLSIHHVQNSGIAFGLFSSATALVTVVTAAAVIWMLVFFARSG